MTDEEFIQLATKFFSREASEDEIEQYHFYNKKKKYAALARHIQSQWDAAVKIKHDSVFPIDRGFQLLKEKIRIYQPSFEWDKPQVERLFDFSSKWLRISAASAFLVLFMASGLFYFWYRSHEIVWNEKKTVMGEQAVVSLPDGTRITLNADSKLTYPARFVGQSREVYLQGEAYFEVQHLSDKPFVIHTENVSTIDLGTRFDIKAYPAEKNITISLEQGSVKVLSKFNSAQQDIVLQPSQQMVYDKNCGKSLVGSFDSEKITGWKNNILIFEDEPIAEVLRSLERSYGVSFQIADTSVLHRSLRAHFHNESLATVVKSLEKATGLASKTIDDRSAHQTIIFFERKP
ncbi:MAG TPA: FecR domain-containing protein [Bacteroidota bacterium]|nr:FecR domain-containing protein [Bacteroidota bacterium]